MSSKTSKARERIKRSLDNALARIEVFGCCTARREAEQILKENPVLQSEYRPFIIDYKLNLN